MCRYPGPLGALQGNIGEGVYEAANMKAKNVTIAFLSTPFLPPRFFYFSSPFPSLVWFSSLSGAKNLSFGPFLLQVSLGSFSKNRLDVLSVKDAFHTQTS